MSVFVDDDTRVVVQGITGGEGRFHTEQMVEYGTNVVAGAVPGKGGEDVDGIPASGASGSKERRDPIPVYDTVDQAVREEDADASVVFVPPAFAADAIFEALDTDLDLVVAITEGIPTQDMAKVYKRLSEVDTRLIGPNCPGIITPNEAKLGILPGNIFESGNVGLVSRSGTLTYQVVDSLTSRGIGQTTAIGIGGDPIIGTDFIDALEAFENDPDTHAVVMCGEIGGEDEEEAAAFIAQHMDTPVAGFIAGRTAPPGKRMGHAGAIVSGSGTGTAESKIDALNDAGVPVGDTPEEVADAIEDLL
jgi:succinyl-CoA synthetase alpha subunit